MKLSIGLVSIVAICMLALPVEPAVEHASVFRFSGDGMLPIYDIHTNQHYHIVYRNKEGTYRKEALDRIDQLLSCPFGEKITISLKLIELMDHLQDHFGADEIEILSGYRSPEYNAALKRRNRRVARQSMHLSGRAVDMKLAGVSSRTLRDYASSLKIGGVGYYGRTRFVHIDTGPVRTW